MTIKLVDFLSIGETLINRFIVILRITSSGFAIDEHKFNEYCYETARLYVNLCDWYFMPFSTQVIRMVLLLSASMGLG